jgi:site-specific recombinase XerC
LTVWEWTPDIFLAYRQALSLDDGLDFHSFRRSYVTHLIEDSWDPRLVQGCAPHVGRSRPRLLA